MALSGIYICHTNTQTKKLMNKGNLIDKVASEAKITKVQANAAIDAFLSSTTTALKKGERVVLVGFGTFMVTKRAARKGRNPQTGKVINIAARKVVRFKIGTELSKKVK
jgi:DNA-binding protein HU-beta